MDNNNSTTLKILEDKGHFKIKLMLQGAFVGLVVGLTIVLYRILVNKASSLFLHVYEWAKTDLFRIIVLLSILAIMGYFSGLLVEKEPMISGSGIPQIMGILKRKITFNPLKVLVFKFVGGLIALTAGLSVGREGPSVQMGGCIGKSMSKIYKNPPMERELLVTSGAAAGLTAAFGAPIAGVMFALEELHKNFSAMVLVSVMSATLISDFITRTLLGVEPELSFLNLKAIPLEYYWALVILGVSVGVLGKVFTNGISLSQDIYGKMKKIPTKFKIVIPFLLTGLIGIFSSELLGGGQNLILSLPNSNRSLYELAIILIIKFLLILICFGSGVAGGIFLPMLLLGALIGNVFGIFISNIFGIPTVFITNFIILGMAGYFTAVVRTPMTGIVLITEMTGSFEHLLSISIVVFFAFIISDLLGSKPVYEILYEKLLKNKNIKEHKGAEEKRLIEVPVELGSLADGKKICEIKWPDRALIVSLNRGDKEIIPKGQYTLKNGDYILLVIDNEKSSTIIDKLERIVKHQI